MQLYILAYIPSGRPPGITTLLPQLSKLYSISENACLSVKIFLKSLHSSKNTYKFNQCSSCRNLLNPPHPSVQSTSHLTMKLPEFLLILRICSFYSISSCFSYVLFMNKIRDHSFRRLLTLFHKDGIESAPNIFPLSGNPNCKFHNFR